MSRWIINGRTTVTYILKKISWNLYKRSIEQRIMDYCRVEFKPWEFESAFTDAMIKQEQAFMSGAKQ